MDQQKDPKERLGKKRNKAFRDMKNLKSEEYKLKFKDLKRKVQRKIRKNYENYIEDLIDPSLVDKGIPRNWSMVKRIKKDSSGVGPLKVDGKLISDSKEKANVLNDQFKSVFNEKNTNDFYLIWDTVLFDPWKALLLLCLGSPNY